MSLSYLSLPRLLSTVFAGEQKAKAEAWLIIHRYSPCCIFFVRPPPDPVCEDGSSTQRFNVSFLIRRNKITNKSGSFQHLGKRESNKQKRGARTTQGAAEAHTPPCPISFRDSEHVQTECRALNSHGEQDRGVRCQKYGVLNENDFNRWARGCI
jgi:hypothetical protein